LDIIKRKFTEKGRALSTQEKKIASAAQEPFPSGEKAVQAKGKKELSRRCG